MQNSLKKNGVAIWLKNPEDLNFIIHNLLEDSFKLSQMKQNIANLAKINSTENICKILLEN